MACLEMYNQNSEHKSLGAPPMSPRISFSIDFVEPSSHSHSHSARDPYRDAPVSSDFAFSVSNYSMMTADELFSKGRILPYKDGGNASQFLKATTLRDELQINEEEDGDFSSRPPKNPTRWRGFLGLRKPHIGSRKSDKYGQSSSVEKRGGSFHYEDNINAQCSKNSQVMHMSVSVCVYIYIYTHTHSCFQQKKKKLY
ncbi:hypothetical protein F511_14596 [Dorcoceras hygrometricum]|uniref:Uncharacterized protein n=1 Tax=Dorcoceras hygrometricum TaxID=472368 RepID=A0A2Z7CS76_9LAMI|nr:hypothetical protein F511_14596 [Dorcoceras hygrometricum]